MQLCWMLLVGLSSYVGKHPFTCACLVSTVDSLHVSSTHLAVSIRPVEKDMSNCEKR